VDVRDGFSNPWATHGLIHGGGEGRFLVKKLSEIVCFVIAAVFSEMSVCVFLGTVSAAAFQFYAHVAATAQEARSNTRWRSTAWV